MAGNNGTCFPDWQVQQGVDQFGPPGLGGLRPIPVYQEQPPVISPNNPVSSTQPQNANLASFAGNFTAANVKLHIIQVSPSNLYDMILIAAFDFAGAGGSTAIGLYFDKPGRVNTASPNPTGTPEVTDWTCPVFSGTDITNYPNLWAFGTNGSNVYSTMQVEVKRTDRPFYVTFYDGFAAGPANTGFRITWTVKGR